MQFIFIFIFHLIRVWLTQYHPGGVKALTWEVIALRQQVIVLQRKQRRAPHLTMWDRLIFAYSTGRVSLKRLKKVAIAIKPSMFFKFHKALVSGKYRILFSRKNQSKSGPKGPPEEVIKLILKLKQRNPSFGYLRIAMQVNDFLKANLHVLEISEVKSVLYTPQSHPFIERLIGTTRRECLNKTFFYSSFDLQKKLDSFK